MTRTCRAIGCAEPPDEPWKIMCGPHWHKVPEPIQREVNRQSATSRERKAAIERAIAAVERAEFGARLL